MMSHAIEADQHRLTWLFSEENRITQELDLYVSEEGGFSCHYRNHEGDEFVQMIDMAGLGDLSLEKKIYCLALTIPVYNERASRFDFNSPERILLPPYHPEENRTIVVANDFAIAIVKNGETGHQTSSFLKLPIPYLKLGELTKEINLLKENLSILPDGRIDPNRLEQDSRLDETKKISRWGKWAVTIVNTQDCKCRGSLLDRLDPFSYSGHAALIIEGVDQEGRYFSLFSDLSVPASSPESLPIVRLLRNDKVYKKKFITYLCEVSKVCELIKAIEEEKKICQTYSDWSSSGEMPDEFLRPRENTELLIPEFFAGGRYSLFNKRVQRIGNGQYETRELAEAYIRYEFGHIPLFAAKLSIEKAENGKFIVIKSPDNCMSWAAKMIAFFCQVEELNKPEYRELAWAPQAEFTPFMKVVCRRINQFVMGVNTFFRDLGRGKFPPKTLKQLREDKNDVPDDSPSDSKPAVSVAYDFYEEEPSGMDEYLFFDLTQGDVEIKSLYDLSRGITKESIMVFLSEEYPGFPEETYSALVTLVFDRLLNEIRLEELQKLIEDGVEVSEEAIAFIENNQL